MSSRSGSADKINKQLRSGAPRRFFSSAPFDLPPGVTLDEMPFEEIWNRVDQQVAGGYSPCVANNSDTDAKADIERLLNCYQRDAFKALCSKGLTVELLQQNKDIFSSHIASNSLIYWVTRSINPLTVDEAFEKLKSESGKYRADRFMEKLTEYGMNKKNIRRIIKEMEEYYVRMVKKLGDDPSDTEDSHEQLWSNLDEGFENLLLRLELPTVTLTR